MSDSTEHQSAPPPPRADYQRAAQDAMLSAKAAAQDAFTTFMKLIYNPVGALPDAYRALAPAQAIGVGVVFAVVAVICLLISGGGLLSMVGGGMLSMGFKGFLIGLGATLGAAAGIAAGSWLSRMLCRGEGNLAFEGILVAIVARSRPLAVPIVALFYGYLRQGAQLMNIRTDVPAEVIGIVTAIIILLVSSSFSMNFLKRLFRRDPAAAPAPVAAGSAAK